MGNQSSAKTSNYISNRMVNQITLNNLNSTVSSQVTNTIMKAQTTSMAISSKTNIIDIGGIKATGPGTVIEDINASIDLNSSITFNSNDSSSQNNTISSEVANAISVAATASLSSEQKAAMVSATENKQTIAGLALTGGNTAESTTNNRINNSSENIVNQNFTNIINNMITTNSSTLTFKECIVKQISENVINVGGIEASDGAVIKHVSLTIKDTSKLVENCIFNTIQSSGILNKMATTMGLTVEDTSTVSQTIARA